MFKGKESSNRIELSRLVQDLLNFGVSGSLRLWGWGVIGAFPPHMCTHTRMHARVVNMIISCKWPPPFGEYLGIPYDVICACMCMCMGACMCMCMWVGCTLSPPPTPIHPSPTPQGGGPPESFKIQ